MRGVKRAVVIENEGTFAVDIWANGDKYQAQAQQLYIEEYRIGVSSQENTETLAAHKAVRNLIDKHN